MKDKDDLTDLYDKYINTVSLWDTADNPKVMEFPEKKPGDGEHVHVCLHCCALLLLCDRAHF